jgi:hypothetical protein
MCVHLRRAGSRLECPRIMSTDVDDLTCKTHLTVEGIRRCGSADHLGRLDEEGWRDRQAQGLGGLQVDDQLEGGGLLHRQVGRLGPLENLGDEGGGTRRKFAARFGPLRH